MKVHRGRSRQLEIAGSSSSSHGLLLVVIPEAGDGLLGDHIAAVSLEEVVEEGEFVAVEDVAVRFGLDARPEIGDGGLEGRSSLGVDGACFAVAGLLEGLTDACLGFGHAG